MEYKEVKRFGSAYNNQKIKIKGYINKYKDTLYLSTGLTKGKILNPKILEDIKEGYETIVVYGTEKIKHRKGYIDGEFCIYIDKYEI
ncbi:MAG: hypothetical protein B6U88_00095 [Candidatus Aenigmarchaeota archaeon ex4484_56]|nr:MAG: hypothetical protein B6U88_00095 [Candidatus Aenigmarchaeota archaeon ex4484_56]